MKEFTAQGLANMVWAAAHLDLQNEIQLLALADAVIDKASLLQTQNVANIAWRFGRLAVRNSRLLQALVYSLAEHSRVWSTKYFQQLLSSCDTAVSWCSIDDKTSPRGAPTDGQIRRSRCVQCCLGHLQPWCCKTGQLVCALRVAALRNQPQMQPQHLSNTVWAHSTLQVPVLELCPACIVRLPEFDLQGLANVSWTAANSIYSDHPLLEATERLLLLVTDPWHALSNYIRGCVLGDEQIFKPHLPTDLGVFVLRKAYSWPWWALEAHAARYWFESLTGWNWSHIPSENRKRRQVQKYPPL